MTFAKAYSGLSDSEIAEVDAFIRRNTVEKFGPVRTVKPGLVFELAFEGIQRSARHKSGVAVRFPRMARIRRDKKIEEADSLTFHRTRGEAKGPTGLREWRDPAELGLWSLLRIPFVNRKPGRTP